MQETRTSVYIGRRVHHKDVTYGTGEWVQGQHKLVDVAVAFKMLRHPDVYEAGVVEAVSTVVVPEFKNRVPEHELEETVAALDAINTMDPDALCDFVSKNFNQKLDRRKSVANLRRDASLLVHQFGVMDDTR